MIRQGVRKVVRAVRGKTLPHTFDCEAERYDQNRARFGLYTPDKLARALRSLAPRIARRKTVLDAGCGTGLFLPVLQTWFDQVVALDVAENMIRKTPAGVLAHHNVLPVVGDFFHHPFEPGSFDCLFCSDFLHHTGQPERFTEVAAQVLGDDGAIIVVEYEPGRLKSRILKLIEEVFLEDLRLVSADELGALLTLKGFDVEHRPISPFEYLLFATRSRRHYRE